MNPQPIKIVIIPANKQTAVFEYNKGLMYATKHNLILCTNVTDKLNKTNYKIINGEIHIRVNKYDFPLIKRKIICLP